MARSVVIDGGSLSALEVAAVAREAAPVSLGDAARASMAAARAVIERRVAAAEPVYGVNTGFGSLSRHRIESGDLQALQLNLVRSHAAGVGEVLPVEVVRAMLVVIAASLARGRSGVRTDLVEAITALLNAGVTPVVPSRGSVGASGDLAPLSHLALVLVGEGEAWQGERRQPGGEALAAAGLSPLRLEAKEGLALINGTHLMTAIGALAIADLARLVPAALGAAALALDACRGSATPLDDQIHIARNQPGQREVAAILRRLLDGSEILPSHRYGDPRVQDPYCLRATPQVLGAALDTIDYVRRVIEHELGAVTDNPLVFAETDTVMSGGNFHGMPIAIALDVLAIALSHMAGIAERRIYWLLKASDETNPVNPYLSPHPGLHSGLMITQYTAAACCNELQTLATPASVANISTAAGIEDYNSMGATAAHQARAAIARATDVIAIELLVMTEAMTYQRPLRSGPHVERIVARIREVVPPLTQDRPPAPDIAAILELIRNGAIADIVDAAGG